MNTDSTIRFLSTEQAAAYLGIGRRTLDNWRSQNQGPDYSRAGRRILYDIDDLVAFLDRSKVRIENSTRDLEAFTGSLAVRCADA